MKKLTVVYKEADTRYARGRAVQLAMLKVGTKGGANTYTIDMDGLPSLGPGVLLVEVADARPRRKPEKKE